MSERDYYKTLGVSADEFKKLAKEYGMERLALFGSFVRGEETPESDVDFLVRWSRKQKMNLDRLFGAKERLEELTGREVDLVSENGMYWRIKERVLREAKDLI